MIRKNFLTGDYVIFSPARLNRPMPICHSKKISTDCPFCLENRNLIGEYLYEEFNQEIRVIENKYPIISEEDDIFGFHYVLIDTKNHNKVLENFSDEHMHYLMRAIKENIFRFYEDERIKYVQFFKNQGCVSGASQHHSHWQILGLPILPKKQQNIVQAFKEHENKTGKCYLCSLNLDEYKIDENEYFVAFCPENSVFFYEVNIMPKEHLVDFKMIDDIMLKELGKILRDSVKRMKGMCRELDYNICLFNSLREEHFHHLFFQIIPRLWNLGGYEISTGMFVNSMLPENAAKILREVKI